MGGGVSSAHKTHHHQKKHEDPKTDPKADPKTKRLKSRDVVDHGAGGAAGALRTTSGDNPLVVKDPKPVFLTCVEKGCVGSSWFGVPGCAATHCALHADPRTMVPWPMRMCSRCCCIGVVEYEGQRLCEIHKPVVNYMDLRPQLCVTCGNMAVMRGRAVRMCEVCDPDRAHRDRTQTLQDMVAALKEADLEPCEWIGDGDDGVKAPLRPDIVLRGRDNKWWVFVECEELQGRHVPMDCDRARMQHLVQARSGVPVVVIRFNPGLYRSPHEFQVSTRHRLRTLTKWVQWVVDNGVPDNIRDLARDMGTGLPILRLFFDGYHAKLPWWSLMLMC